MTPEAKAALGWVLTVFVGCVLLLGGCTGAVAGYKAFARYQQRADNNQNRSQRLLNEQNTIQVNRIKIAQTDQLVKVAQQGARIREANAVGIRNAQDEIAKTLTPLYVQFEMIQALERISTSGRNNSVIFIPTGKNGLPITPTINTTNPRRLSVTGR